MSRPHEISLAAARRIIGRMVGRLGLLKIDSVNVVSRAHYLPLLSATALAAALRAG